MTISTSGSSIQVSGTGSQFTYNFPFIADSSEDITVTAIASNGAETILSTNQYTLVINPPAVNQLWGVGGSVTYPLSGSALPVGQGLLIQRNLPLVQDITVRNQGNYFAQVTEQALDILCMEIQQVAARTGQMRGTWATNVVYNFGDVVVDGGNGNSTGNLYMCANANTSGTWSTDLSAGDWSLALNIQAINAVIGAYLPLTGGTIAGSLVITGSASISGNLTVGGSITGTVTPSNNSITNAMLAQMAANTVKVNNLASTSNATDLSLASSSLLGRGSTGNISGITLGGGLSLIGQTLNTAAANAQSISVTAPSGTTNTVGVMMGLGTGSITPAGSGIIKFDASGTVSNSAGGINAAKVQLRYGTGVAPSNGAAVTGTLLQQIPVSTANNNYISPFSMSAIVPGLVIGTAYWLDVAVSANAGGTSAISNVVTNSMEIK